MVLKNIMPIKTKQQYNENQIKAKHWSQSLNLYELWFPETKKWGRQILLTMQVVPTREVASMRKVVSVREATVVRRGGCVRVSWGTLELREKKGYSSQSRMKHWLCNREILILTLKAMKWHHFDFFK